ncbi:aldehyde dehydrogenase family protein [Streptomyces sp. NPDC051773]|uniref:aldehyde dehydrogenase family protein n=1 Tax=Streptomyces sp. NPDC051773 TaxID=3156682 RepID=UPI003418C8B4
MDNSAVVAREEIFGPVLVVPYDDVDQAVAIARAMRTGTVGVNFYNIDSAHPSEASRPADWGVNWAPRG